MKKTDFINKLNQLKNNSTYNVTQIDQIDQIIDIINTDEEIIKIKSFREFYERLQFNDSRLDDYSALLDRMLADSIERLKPTAVYAMRQRRKSSVMIVIAILILLALTAMVLGILSAMGKISEVWCNIVGVADCVFGISFFAYELFDDKVQESKIDSGDYATIEYYIKKIKTGKIVNKGNGNFNNTGTVNGDISVGTCTNGNTKHGSQE